MSTRRPALLAVTALVAAAALAGCGGGSDDDPAPAAQSAASESPSPESPSTSPSMPETSSEPPSPSPTPTPTVSTPPASASLSDRLLTAGEVPGLNEVAHWAAGVTRPQEPKPLVGTCERFPLTSIGATDVAYRSYQSPGPSPDSAEELVAEFPDTATTARAWKVLQSWHDQCAQQLRRYRTKDVGPLKAVSVAGGQGAWYLLVYGPADEDPNAGVFDAQGMARVGTRIAMVEMKSIGQDYDYPPGHEPMVTGVQAAAAKLAR
ncbi:MAG: hypothetical protein HOQ22_06020 [Nocardioidaceae bacterium]|nr:hypothetical protein [Nocardioidaceae bacterium]NUS50585.1 hypothetical protein [Nocardioidaceae bacterium]